WRQVGGRHRKKYIAIENERDHPDVQHAAPEPHREREKDDRLSFGIEYGRKPRAEHRYGLGRDNGNQPTAMNSLRKSRLGFFDRDSRENRIGENYPQDDRKQPERQRQPRSLENDQPLAAKNAGCRDRGEKARRTTVVNQIAEKTRSVPDQSRERQHQKDCEKNQVQPAKRNADDRHLQQIAGNRDDP